MNITNTDYNTIAITGATSGIGKEIAKNFSSKGFSIAALGRSQKKLEVLESETSEFSGSVSLYQVDLRNEENILRTFNKIISDLGHIDVWINNAGLGYESPLIDGETKKWQEMLEVNVLALSICTREAIRHMNQRNFPGYIIHINSLSGHRIYKEGGMYAASKYAVTALTEGLRRELHQMKSSIRISQLSLGLVMTEFHEKYYQDSTLADQIYDQFTPLTGKNISEAVEFLLNQPLHVQFHDLQVRPIGQES